MSSQKKTTRSRDATISVQRREAFSIVPDRILEDKKMRTETRLVLAWLIGRPDNWTIFVRHVQKALGLSPRRWARARTEMEQEGYLVQRRDRDEQGQYVWTHIVSDTPNLKATSIPPKPTDGLTMAGKAVVGEGRDKPTRKIQKESNQQYTNRCAVSHACIEEARRRFPGWDIYALERTWLEWVDTKLDKPRFPDKAFLGWLKRYTDLNPLPDSHLKRLGLHQETDWKVGRQG